MCKELQVLLRKATNGLCRLLPLRNPPGPGMLRGSLLCPSPSRQGRPPAPQPCVGGAPSHPIRPLLLITSRVTPFVLTPHQQFGGWLVSSPPREARNPVALAEAGERGMKNPSCG